MFGSFQAKKRPSCLQEGLRYLISYLSVISRIRYSPVITRIPL
jgi:hypothetical protein